MRNKPSITTNSNPVGVDKVILKIQNKLALLTYLDESNNEVLWFDSALIYGMVERSADDLPYILWKGKEFHKVLPDDNYRSICFFYEHDPREIEDGLYKYDLSLIVWYDQHKIDNELGYRISEYAIQEVENTIDNCEGYEIKIYKDKNSIFQDFSMSRKKEGQIFTDRFDGFRIRFSVSSESDCGVTFKKKVVL